MTIETYLPFISSLIISGLVYWALRDVRVTLGKSPTARLEAYASADRRGALDKLGDSLIDRLGLSLDAWKHDLKWAQLGGYYQGKTVGSILGQSVAMLVFGLLFMLVFQNFSLTYLAVFAGAVYYPVMSLRGDANKVREAVRRSLPEAAAMIAAEMSAGSSAETAVQRAAAIPGPLGKMLHTAVEASHQTGRLIFSRAGVEGMLLSYMSSYRMPELNSFASQIDMVAERGADGPKQMREVVRGLAREYRATVSKQAEQMDGKLLMPVTVFFFIPLMAAVFVPLILSILQTF